MQRRQQQPFEYPIAWIGVTNATSETIPPFGVVEVKSISNSTGIAAVGKPSRDSQSNVFFNSSCPIPPGGAGQVHRTGPAIVAVSGDDPAHDDTVGAVADSWYLSASQTGFRVIGTGGYGLCNVIQEAGAASNLRWVKVGSSLTGSDAVGTNWSYACVSTTPQDDWTWDDGAESGWEVRNQEGLQITQDRVLAWEIEPGKYVTDVQGGETATNIYVENVTWNEETCEMTKTRKNAYYVHGKRMKTESA